ncbi:MULTISPECIES: hypothetical protein [unclassified Undibacterium]|uniref:hypothetical protein n=1 Tax=unclassified Undibacterium TaxID=2630295 RepID=UPI002AC954EF|nr:MULTISPECIES: hypothetical protein [unclassified Undibacterium]MEB0215669.1 hypothetical protein [Undibacterium sp. 5I2]WPX42947.1 hypothetical protein RHM61_16410 [Undibacterium sp. CCC3.4]
MLHLATVKPTHVVATSHSQVLPESGPLNTLSAVSSAPLNPAACGEKAEQAQSSCDRFTAAIGGMRAPGNFHPRQANSLQYQAAETLNRCLLKGGMHALLTDSLNTVASKGAQRLTRVAPYAGYLVKKEEISASLDSKILTALPEGTPRHIYYQKVGPVMTAAVKHMFMGLSYSSDGLDERCQAQAMSQYGIRLMQLELALEAHIAYIGRQFDAALASPDVTARPDLLDVWRTAYATRITAIVDRVMEHALIKKILMLDDAIQTGTVGYVDFIFGTEVEVARTPAVMALREKLTTLIMALPTVQLAHQQNRASVEQYRTRHPDEWIPPADYLARIEHEHISERVSSKIGELIIEARRNDQSARFRTSPTDNIE